MPEYTIQIVNEMQYHVDLNEADGLGALNNNNQITRTFDNDAAFRAYIIEFCEELRAAYDMAHNKEYDAIRDALWTDHQINLEEDLTEEEAENFNISVYVDFTYPIVEYEINGREATITLSDEIDPNGQAQAGEVIETEDQVRVREQQAQQAAIPQFFDTLVPNGIIPRIVAVGTTFTLEEFRQLGPYRIEHKLIYDNYLIDPEDGLNKDEDGNYDMCDPFVEPRDNVVFPVRTVIAVNGIRRYGGIYCMQLINHWINDKGKNTDPVSNAIIMGIHIMTEQEIRDQEWEDIQDQRRTLNTEIRILRRKRQNRKKKLTYEEVQKLRRELIKKERQLRNLPKSEDKYNTAKIKRMGMNRVILNLKF